jgi:hypothetical protein
MAVQNDMEIYNIPSSISSGIYSTNLWVNIIIRELRYIN